MNARAREFLSAAMASGCAVAVAHDAGATTVTGGQNGVPTGFGDIFANAYVLPAGTTEVIGTIGAEQTDWFEFQDLPVGSFTVDVASSGTINGELGNDIHGKVYDSTHTLINGNTAGFGGSLSLTGTTPGDGEIVISLQSEGNSNFDAQLTSPQLSAAPEPETWTLMIGGALATGAMLRRKRRLTLKAPEAAA
jgi:hypothetical protein